MLNMNDSEEVALIRNQNELCFTTERRILSEVLENAFSQLSPAKILRKEINGLISSINPVGKLYVIGFGKASLKMYEGIRDVTGDRATFSALIIPVGETVTAHYQELEILRGNHPIPGDDTLQSSLKLWEAIQEHSPEDVFVVLISGGGSALFEIPDDNLSIKDIGLTAKCLMNSGADIRELNIIRHLMSKVKGGKLAGHLYPSQVYSYVISDVPGDDLQLISSGPLTKPEYSEAEVSQIVEKYSPTCHDLEKIYENSGKTVVNDAAFKNVHQKIILKNLDFVSAISSYLSSLDNTVFKLDTPVTGNVDDVAAHLTEQARMRYQSTGKPVWLIAGGETTAIVRGNGIGGRNCELSLRVALKMNKDEDFMFASIGTDGIDGVSPAMGGVTDSWFKGNVQESDIENSLEESDSYTLLQMHNSAIMTGYTGTNVSDVFILYYSTIHSEA